MKEFNNEQKNELEDISVKAIKGEMVEDDFAKLGELFNNIKKSQYSKYLDVLAPNLSDEALHKLVAGLLDYNAKNMSSSNTFLRNDDIVKGLLIVEAERHGFKVNLSSDPMTVPSVIPDTILDHYKVIVEKHPEVFYSNDKQLNIKNIHTSLSFNLTNSIITTEADRINLSPIETMNKLSAVQQATGKLLEDVEAKVRLENGKVVVDVQSLKLNSEQNLNENQIKQIAEKSASAMSQPKAQKEAEENNKEKTKKTSGIVKAFITIKNFVKSMFKTKNKHLDTDAEIGSTTTSIIHSENAKKDPLVLSEIRIDAEVQPEKIKKKPIEWQNKGHKEGMQKGKYIGVKKEIREERVAEAVGDSDVKVVTDKPVDTIGSDKRISVKLVNDIGEKQKQGDVINVLADNQQRNGDGVKEDKDKKEELVGIKKLIQQYEPHAHASSHVEMVEHKKEQVAIEGYKGGVKDRIKNWEEKALVEDKDNRNRTK